MRRTKPLPIDFTKNNWDRKVKYLKNKGFTHETISKATGLTLGQVAGRVKKGNLGKSLKYRRGQSPQARRVIERIDQLLGDVRKLRHEIEMFHRKQVKFRQFPRIAV